MNCIDRGAFASIVRSFWLLGLLNNAPWVLMLACATNIASGGVALVFLSNQIPGLIVKLTAPYWFHLVSYKRRILMASIAMAIACFLVGCGGLFHDEMSEDNKTNQMGLALELLGVSFVSFSCNLGEASLLALAGRFDSIILPSISSPTNSTYLVVSEEQTNNAEHTLQQNYDTENIFTEEYQLDNNNDTATQSDDNAVSLMMKGNETKSACITAFSSGTGLAGIVGFGYKALFSDVFGLGLSSTIYSAMLFAIAYAFIYLKGLHHMETVQTEQVQPVSSESSLLVNNSQTSTNDNANSALEMVSTEVVHQTNSSQQLDITQRSDSTISSSQNLTSFERFMLVLSLWPYTIPLFTVYAAEYMLQAGVWSAIGFPVTSITARAQFYHYSNWTYQVGVFISRSSGNMWSASTPILWLMPFLQVVNLYFFWFDSIYHFWYNYYLLLPCFFAGLLGGGVYVQGYSRVNKDLPMEQREFAIASVMKI